ncbi:Hypothetical predicted protein [Cloeon dipterum]|uniref:Uncharacterized protein n=1 Tax=Cloeon dipterum TaxID=197152 RepID=A0A8S1E022_9INSE|nr:Hypothetical predicted protein [Cloeon dipterum]
MNNRLRSISQCEVGSGGEHTRGSESVRLDQCSCLCLLTQSRRSPLSFKARHFGCSNRCGRKHARPLLLLLLLPPR